MVYFLLPSAAALEFRPRVRFFYVLARV